MAKYVIAFRNGEAHQIYDEGCPIAIPGKKVCKRASHVEPVEGPENTVSWVVDLTPLGGPIFPPLTTRTQALAAERQWIEDHYLRKAQNV